LEKRETRNKALELEAEYLQKQLDEIRERKIEDKIKSYEAELYNEKLEKDMAVERAKTLEKEKEKFETELFEIRVKYEKLIGEVDTNRRKDGESSHQITSLTTENTSLKDKLATVEQKLSKYKRSVKQQLATIEKLQVKQKEPLSFNAWVQTEESFPSFEHVKSRDETILCLNGQMDELEEKNRQLRVQLEYYAAQAHHSSSYSDDIIRENQNLKNMLNEMNRQRSKDDQRRRMLERELEIRDLEIEKRNKFIRKMNESSMHYMNNDE